MERKVREDVCVRMEIYMKEIIRMIERKVREDTFM
jgi:hypothetical protein